MDELAQEAAVNLKVMEVTGATAGQFICPELALRVLQSVPVDMLVSDSVHVLAIST